MNFRKLSIFIIFLIIIINNSISFTVEKYDDALAYLRYLGTFKGGISLVSSLNEIKGSLVIIEVTYKNEVIQKVRGYVNEKSILILRSLLISTDIKSIKYFYLDKQIVIGKIELISDSKKSKFISIINGIPKNNNIKYEKFISNFFDSRFIRKVCCDDVNETIIDKKSKMTITPPYNLYVDIYNYYFKIDLDLIFTSKFIRDTGFWFIIGTVKGKIDTELEIISLMHVADNIKLNNLVSIYEKTKYNLFMFVDNNSFGKEDVGSYLVKCYENSSENFVCKIFGQIIEVFSNSLSNNILVISAIYQSLFTLQQPNFKSYEINQIEIPKVMTLTEEKQIPYTITTINTDHSDKQSKKRPLDDSWVDGDSKKKKLNFNEHPSSIQESLSCSSINEEGFKNFDNNISIFITEIETNIWIAEIVNKFIIKGIYTKNGQSFEFGLCTNTDRGINLFRSVDDKEPIANLY